MVQPVIPYIVEKLIKITRYVSPVYIAEFDKETPGGDVDRPGLIHFKDVKDDNILEWLANNSLCVLRDPEIVSSHRGYFFQGNGGSCIVHADHQEVNPIAPLYRSNQNMSYERRLTIKYQPTEFRLQEELVAALEEKGFKEVEEFQRYAF